MANENMIKSNSTLQGEIVDLAEAIALLTPIDTPLYTMLVSKGRFTKANDITVTWRERELNNTRSLIKVEGSECGEPIHSSRKLLSNICQIMERVTSISGTMSSLSPKGISNVFASEINDRLMELKRDCEYYFLNGVKATESGSTGRQMNGLFNLISTDNVVDLAKKTTGKGTLTEDDIIDAIQKMWENGVSGNFTMFVNASSKRLINEILKKGTSTRVVANQGENKLGITVNTVETDFGNVDIVLDRHMPTDKVIIVDLDQVEVAELRPTFYEELAKTGDYKKGHVLCENTIKLLNSKSGAIIQGIGKNA